MEFSRHQKIENIAVIVAHPDDEVLGCGGTIARMAEQGHKIHVLFLADGESSREGLNDKSVLAEKISHRRKSAKEACSILGVESTEFHDFPDNRLDGVDLLEMVKIIEKFIIKNCTSILFTHHSGDTNIDHRRVHDATIAATRPLPDCVVKTIYFFETSSSTEWRPPSSNIPFVPNCYFDISKTFEKKINALKSYDEELRDFPHPRSPEAIKALANWRGASSGLATAEAFIIGRQINLLD